MILSREAQANAVGAFIVLLVAALAVGLLFAAITAIPVYRAYSMEKTGEGQLRAARLERQALVAQAEAERDAAELRAEAIQIIGEAAQDFPEYRQQEFIGAFAKCLEQGCADTILYVPTEANIPITEAGRRGQ